jgi:hypothetical protein
LSTIDICEGTASLTTAGASGQILWSTGAETPTVSISENGLYSVTITNNCGAATDSVAINTLENNTPTISSTATYIFTGADTTIMADLQSDAESITWTPTKGLSCTDCLDPIITADASITYTVVASNANGCEASILVNLRQERTLSPDLTIANIFNPDSSNPSNQRFYFPVEFVGTYDMQVFDRWGNTLYNAVALPAGDPTHGWDGNWGGDPASNGAYAYLITFELNGELVCLTGSVSLLR